MTTFQTGFGDWEIREDGTAIDLRNKIMWMRSPMGTGGPGQGTMIVGDFPSVTSRFGRGIDAYGQRDKNLGEIVKEAITKSSASKAYKTGSDRVMFAGHADWRLPTLDEAVTLMFDEGWGASRIRVDDCRPIDIWKSLLAPMCLQGRFWTATRCHESPRSFLGIVKYSTFAWSFSAHGGTPTITDTGGTDTEETAGVLLMRRT
jgi:hypothetical protein